MKNLGYIILAAFLAISNIACESDATLDETRVADITAPTVSLKTVTVDKFNAIFEVSLDATGDPATREYGVLISTESQPDMTNSTILAADITQNIASISATLAPGTTYYTCAYALTANQFITSEVKTFTTEEHYLGAFLGKHTLSGYNLSIEGSPVVPIEIEIVADDTNEKVAYLKGLSSFAGVELVLDPVTLIFDLEKGTVTFNTAPPKPEDDGGVEGQDWVHITYSVTTEGYSQRITKCTTASHILPFMGSCSPGTSHTSTFVNKII